MSVAWRRHPSLLVAVVGAAAIAFAPSVVADPNIHTESAAAVIEQLQGEGYAVDVNGAPAGDTSLLTTCTVTSIRHAGAPTPDPTVYVIVACPITHG
jgi:hypothetical protein